MDMVLIEMRKSKRSQQEMSIWDRLVKEEHRDFKNLEFMIVDSMKREQQLKTSQQIRNQNVLEGSGGGQFAQPVVVKTNSVCNTWKSKGYCNKGDSCGWLHPEDQRKSAPTGKLGKGKRGKGNGRDGGRVGGASSRESFASSRASSKTSTGKPRCVTFIVMVSAIFSWCFWSSAKFSGPYDQCTFQKSAFL